jgi:hypothetical protein
MDHLLNICKQNITLLYEQLENVINRIGEDLLVKSDRETLSHFQFNYKNFTRSTLSPLIDTEDAITSAKIATGQALVLAMSISNNHDYSIAARSAAGELVQTATNFMNILDRGQFKGSLEVSSFIPGEETISVSKHEKQIIELGARLRSEIKTFERDIAKGADEIEQLKQKSSANYERSNDEISELTRTVEQLKSNITSLHENMATESSKAAKFTEDAAEHSKVVHSQIDELLGQTASKVLLVDYANTAEAEKKSADSMRNWSLVCMALTGGVLFFALYESLGNAFDWKQSILKLFTAIALSVPAAYLARESAKHRNQEHINRRISLDLRAITPYIATLPSDEQNKIKSEVASKIFGVQENGNTPPDNYPINIQELVKSIIEKIPTSK